MEKNENNITNGEKALKSGVWYVVGNFMAKSAGFITMPIFTRLLTKGEVGDFSNFLSWIEILIVVSTLNLHSSVAIARFDFPDDLNGFIKSNLTFGTGITIIVYLVCLVFQGPFCKYTGLSVMEMNTAFIYLMVYPASQMLMIRSRIQYDYKNTIIISLLLTFSSTIGSLLLTLLADNRLVGRIMGYFIPMITVNVVVYILFLKENGNLRIKYCKYAFLIALPYAWHTLAGSLLGSSDRVMIKNICGNDDNALYSVAYYCGLLISVLWAAVNNAFSPWAYEQLHDNNQVSLKKTTRLIIVLMIIVVMCFLLVAPELLLLMGGREYYSALKVIPPVMIAYVVQVVYSFYVNIEFYCKKQIYIAAGTTIAAITNIVLNLLFIPAFGYIAAAFTTLVGYLVLYLCHNIIVKKMGYSEFLDSRFYNLCLLLCIAYMFFAYWLYEFNVLRIVLLCIIALFFLALVIVFRIELLDLIKTKKVDKLIIRINKILKR